METRTSGSEGGLGKRNACEGVNAPQSDPTRPRTNQTTGRQSAHGRQFGSRLLGETHSVNRKFIGAADAPRAGEIYRTRPAT